MAPWPREIVGRYRMKIIGETGWNRKLRTERTEQDRTGQKVKDSKDRTVRTESTGQRGLNRTEQNRK